MVKTRNNSGVEPLPFRKRLGWSEVATFPSICLFGVRRTKMNILNWGAAEKPLERQLKSGWVGSWIHDSNRFPKQSCGWPNPSGPQPCLCLDNLPRWQCKPLNTILFLTQGCFSYQVYLWVFHNNFYKLTQTDIWSEDDNPNALIRQ